MMPLARSPNLTGGAGSRAWTWAGDIVLLSKPRITGMVLLVTLFGYLMARPYPLDASRLALTLLGTMLVGAGGNALNQYLERNTDKLMHRTRERPLPAGRMSAGAVLSGGTAAALGGFAALAWGAHPLAAGVAVAVVVTYVLMYTPLKRVTGLNTLVGAIPGALPPVLGWAAAVGTLDRGALALFLILFVWQLPHFLAIAYLYRDEYAAASIPMLTVADPGGSRMRRQMILHATVLIPVSLYPAVIGMTGQFYFYAALGLGLAYLAVNLAMALVPSLVTARAALRASLVYLPALFSVMYFSEPSL